MKVFISWSGATSHDVALALRDWLPAVLQSIEPYVSSEDIEKGARWSAEIGRQLDDTAFGILCVTTDNMRSPWLNFEAGALSKSVDTSRVTPFLLGLKAAELTGPLSQFQATLPELTDVSRLLQSINAVSERPIVEVRLADAVEMWWPKLEEQLQTVLTKDRSHPAPRRDTQEMVEELLEITRGLQRLIIRDEMAASSTADRHDEEVIRASQEQLAIDEIRGVLAHHGFMATSIRVTGRNVLADLEKSPPRSVRLELLEAAHRYGFHFQSRNRQAAEDLETGQD